MEFPGASLSKDTDMRSLPMDPRVLLALARMKVDPTQQFAVTRVAAQVGLSRSRFQHLFKELTGHSFTSCLKRFRLARAELLLADSGLSIKEIGFRCGYSNAPSFSRDFKRQFGSSPSSYRNSTLRQEIAQSITTLLLNAS